MKVDTGATLSVISETTYNSLWVNQASPPLQLCDGQLKIHRPTIGMGSHEMLHGTPPPTSYWVISPQRKSWEGEVWSQCEVVSEDEYDSNVIHDSATSDRATTMEANIKVTNDDLS